MTLARSWAGLVLSLVLAACSMPAATATPAPTITASPPTRTPVARQTPTAVAQRPIPTAPVPVRHGIEILVVPLVVAGVEAGETLVVEGPLAAYPGGDAKLVVVAAEKKPAAPAGASAAQQCDRAPVAFAPATPRAAKSLARS